MPKKAQRPHSYLAVLVLLVTAFLLSGVSVSAKSALGGSDFSLGSELAKVDSKPLTVLEKSLWCRWVALGICDGPEGHATNNISYQPPTRPTATTPANTILGDLDGLGRPTGVTATIKPETLNTGSSASSSIRPPGFEGQPANHARGHLLANSLGGAGNDARNLVTLFQRNANHPNMSSFERQVSNAVKNGETVNFRAIPIYTGSNPVPTGVTLTARGSNGLNLDVSIPNVSGVK